MHLPPLAPPPPQGDTAVSPQQIQSGDILEKPVPAACTECRRKHVRCDGGVPVCARCTSTGSQCHYLPSRRGLKRRACDLEQPAQQHAHRSAACLHEPGPSSYDVGLNTGNASPSWIIAEEQRLPSPTAARSTPPSPAAGSNTTTAAGEYGQRYQMQPWSEAEGPAPTGLEFLRGPDQSCDDSQPLPDNEALINLFYANFHVAHPFLVPRTLYSDQNYPEYLRRVVHFVGSHFSGTTSSDSLRYSTGEALAQASSDSSGQATASHHLVQAKMLFSIALHARNEIKESVSVLAQAVALALELGMNRAAFSAAGGVQSSIQAESLRRTWWELYVTDGFMAALQRKTSFLCHVCEPDVPLPCDESLYVEGAYLMEPPTLTQFNARIFAEEELPFSSFCYRIEAIQVLARVLAISGSLEVHEEQVQAIDNTLAAWPHHLPAGKTTACGSLGEIDEMLFQAHMLIQYTTIYLHFPRSHLVEAVPATSDIIRQRHLIPVSTRNMHGIKAIEASKQLGDLAALHAPVGKHTPFFIFAIVFSAVVQLSACSQQGVAFHEQYRDRISLVTGVLKTLGPIWAFSQVVMRKVRRIAADVLQTGPKAVPANGAESTVDSGIGLVFQANLPNTSNLSWMDLFGVEEMAQGG